MTICKAMTNSLPKPNPFESIRIVERNEKVLYDIGPNMPLDSIYDLRQFSRWYKRWFKVNHKNMPDNFQMEQCDSKSIPGPKVVNVKNTKKPLTESVLEAVEAATKHFASEFTVKVPISSRQNLSQYYMRDNGFILDFISEFGTCEHTDLTYGMALSTAKEQLVASIPVEQDLKNVLMGLDSNLLTLYSITELKKYFFSNVGNGMLPGRQISHNDMKRVGEALIRVAEAESSSDPLSFVRKVAYFAGELELLLVREENKPGIYGIKERETYDILELPQLSKKQFDSIAEAIKKESYQDIEIKKMLDQISAYVFEMHQAVKQFRIVNGR